MTAGIAAVFAALVAAGLTHGSEPDYVPAIAPYRGCPTFEVDRATKTVRYEVLTESYGLPNVAWSPDSTKLLVKLSRQAVEPMFENAACTTLFAPITDVDSGRPDSDGVFLVLEEEDQGLALLSLSETLARIGPIRTVFWRDSGQSLRRCRRLPGHGSRDRAGPREGARPAAPGGCLLAPG